VGLQTWMEHPFCSMLYTPREFSEDNFKLLSSLREYPLWIAPYSTDDQPKLPSNWNVWAFWQYTNRAQIGTALFDANYFNGRKKDLENFVGAN
jgi:GH25 family lysozyme M1 (1,4-beta-N-acetylmuramidase)